MAHFPSLFENFSQLEGAQLISLELLKERGIIPNRSGALVKIETSLRNRYDFINS